MFHLADIAMLTTGIINGCTHVFAAAFNPPEVMALIVREKVTEVLLVPTMIQVLLDHPDFADYDLSSLNRILYGTSVISEGLLASAMLALPNTRFSQAYGMTEMGPVISTLGAEYHTPEGMKRGKLRSAGKPNCVVDVCIVDNQGDEVPCGTVGEVTAYGPNVMLGYWNRPDENTAALQKGWMHTGDGGYMDEEGFLFIVDRVKDVIISGGENVYSAEVENALGQHVGIAQSAVIGVPSEQWGETVHAIIVLKPGAEVTGEEVMAHCHDLIAGYKCPRSVELRESLPLSGTGKIQKNELRKPFWVGRSRNIC
jgi:long-chain acyl-CoA synthetase